MPLLTPSRRRLVQALALGAAAWFATSSALAQAAAFPSKPVRLVVPFGAGGGGDTLARFLAERLAPALGQPVIVENKPGGSTIIATQEVIRAEPDGHTILLNVPLLVQAPAMQEKPAFDAVRDLAPVIDLVTSPLWLAVNAEKVSARDVKEFAQYARANAGKLSYGSIGQGSSGHLLGHLLNERNKLDMVHVPYKGSSQAYIALLAGDVAGVFLDYVTLRAQVETGKLRLLASTGEKRSTMTPNVPTFTEAGFPGFEFLSWAGLFVPAKTPPAVIARLEKEVGDILRRPDAVARFKELGYEPGGRPRAEFADLIRRDQQRWGELIRSAGIKLN